MTTTNTTTTVQIVHIPAISLDPLVELQHAFVQQTREDGSKFWALTPTHGIDSPIHSLVRDLHDDEMPNDWRYAAIVSLIDALFDVVSSASLNGEDLCFEDLIDSIDLDTQTDIYTSDLLDWAKVPGRLGTWELIHGEPAEGVYSVEDLIRLDQHATLSLMLAKLADYAEEQSEKQLVEVL